MKTMWKNYEIESEFKGEKCSSWDTDNYDRHHVITVRNLDTGKMCLFNYWTSKAHPQIDNESELRNAVECYFTDAESGMFGFEEFCREMGYDIPDGIYNTWRACRVASCRVRQVFDKNWNELANELREEIYD